MLPAARSSDTLYPVDFLLECIGFPPDFDLAELVDIVLERGEPAPWRGPAERHRRLPLGGGLELRLDREDFEDHWTLLPYYRSPYRVRVAVDGLRTVPDSPWDAQLVGWVGPPVDCNDPYPSGKYALSALLTDARRLPRKLARGHVLAVSVAGFALDVSYVGPNEGARDTSIVDAPHGASIVPLGGPADPGGCADVSTRIRELRHLRNPITGRAVDLLEVDAPERPLHLFVSPWQLARDRFEPPRTGWRIEGSFLFTGRIEGGLPVSPRRDVFG
jgi:hypothetical protein